MESRVELVNHTKVRHIRATIEGDRPIMLDRYPGDNKTELEPWQKFYLNPHDGGKTIVFPSANIMSALTAQNTDSWPKSLRDPRSYKKLCHAFAQSVSIEEESIPFLRDDEAITLGKFENDEDPVSGAYLHRTVARLEKGIPNPKVRPVLPAPWMLKFVFQLRPCGTFVEQDLVNIMTEGLSQVGIGTFRRTFGRASLTGWDALD